MSIKVIEKIKQSMDLAYQKKDSILLEKETQSVLYSLANLISETFSDSVRFVQYRKTKLKSGQYLMLEKNKTLLSQVLHLLDGQKEKKNEFKDVKIAFEKYFQEVTDDGLIEYIYEASELVSVEYAAEFLGVPKPTIYNYMDNGLEYTLINHVKKIPRVALELWADSDTALDLECGLQQNKISNKTLEEKSEDIQC